MKDHLDLSSRKIIKDKVSVRAILPESLRKKTQSQLGGLRKKLLSWLRAQMRSSILVEIDSSILT